MTLPPGYASIRGTARALECAASTLVAAMDDGRIPETAIVRDPSGKRIGLQIEVVRASMAANTDRLQSARHGMNWRGALSDESTALSGVTPSDRDLGAEIDEEVLKEKRRKNMQAAGELVEAAAIEREIFALARQTRDAMLVIPDRVASILAAETDPARVHLVLLNEIRNGLSAVAKVCADD